MWNPTMILSILVCAHYINSAVGDTYCDQYSERGCRELCEYSPSTCRQHIDTTICSCNYPNNEGTEYRCCKTGYYSRYCQQLCSYQVGYACELPNTQKPICGCFWTYGEDDAPLSGQYTPGLGGPQISGQYIPGLGGGLISGQYSPGLGGGLISGQFTPGLGGGLISGQYSPGLTSPQTPSQLPPGQFNPGVAGPQTPGQTGAAFPGQAPALGGQAAPAKTEPKASKETKTKA